MRILIQMIQTPFPIIQSTLHPRGFTPIWLAVVTLFCLPLLSIGVVHWQSRGDLYSVEKVPPKDAALVLGAAVYGEKLSDILEDRVDTAIKLYKEDKVQILIMSGAEHEAHGMKLYAMEQGVPGEDITEDPKGLNTFYSVENLKNSKKSLAIVSQSYHLPRALFIAQKLGLEAVGVVAEKNEYLKMGEFKRREWVATSWIVFYLVFLEKADSAG